MASPPKIATTAYLTGHQRIAIYRPGRMMIFRVGRVGLESITVHALDHPEKEVVLVGESKVSPVNQTEGQEIAPRAGYEERELDR